MPYTLWRVALERLPNTVWTTWDTRQHILNISVAGGFVVAFLANLLATPAEFEVALWYEREGPLWFDKEFGVGVRPELTAQLEYWHVLNGVRFVGLLIGWLCACYKHAISAPRRLSSVVKEYPDS